MAANGRAISVSLAPTRAEATKIAPADCAFDASDRTLRAIVENLRRYFRGEPVGLSRHPVDISTQPPFMQRALRAARSIPYGQVRTYGWLAAAAGSAKAARAAGQAMARNPLPLLVPCHRVVGAGGKLTGFGGGLPLKRALLELEGLTCTKDRVQMHARHGSRKEVR